MTPSSALARSTSWCAKDVRHGGKDLRCRRSNSFTLTAGAPRCPGGETKKEERSEWQILALTLRVAFFRSVEVSVDHPAGACLCARNLEALRDELFSLGSWKAGQYTRTLLLDGECFNVMLLCWAPGCESPVHGHSCAETFVHSNCFLLVLEGDAACCDLVETIYGDEAVLPDGRSVDARQGKAVVRKAGQCTYINDDIGLHKVGNPSNSLLIARSSNRAVSLHVYAPGWKRPPQHVQNGLLTAAQLTTTASSADGRPPLYDEIFPEVDAGGAEIDGCDGWGDF